MAEAPPPDDPTRDPADPTDPAEDTDTSDPGEPTDPDRYPQHPPVTQLYNREGPRRVMLMTPKMATIGALLAFFAVVALVVVLPVATYDPPVSDNWLPLSDEAATGRELYLGNGCVYCHSGFSRPQDVAEGLYYLYPRVAEPGDFSGANQSPNVLGTERTGPDLSQEGGMHPDDWHAAHYTNPRFTMPKSIMPELSFWSDADIERAVAFNQSQGGKEAALRYAAVVVGDRLMLVNKGLLSPNVAFPRLTAQMVEGGDPRLELEGKPSDKSPWGLPWMAVWMVNSFERSYWLTEDPLPLTQENLIQGKQEFLERCSGCHGAQGDGNGPGGAFLAPKPFDFTQQKVLSGGPQASDGMFYHRILTAGPGTAMERFGTRLSVEDIWRLVLFLRTIPNGGLTESVPTTDMYVEWTPPAALLRYLDDFPVDGSAGFSHDPDQDPFMTAARWVAPGLSLDPPRTEGRPDYVLVGGKLPMDLQSLSDLIEATYFELVDQAWSDAVARGDDGLPSRDAIFSTEGLVFHEPS